TKMKRVYFVLCVLFSILNINFSEENSPHRENDSSIFYYGLINNTYITANVILCIFETILHMI
ncbi:hypothetical protein, partial [Plasmodium yoelii yoelii]